MCLVPILHVDEIMNNFAHTCKALHAVSLILLQLLISL